MLKEVLGDVLEAYGAVRWRSSDRLMVIFSAGGLVPSAHLRATAVRCVPGMLPSAGPPQVVLDRYPDAGSRGLLDGGEARVVDAGGATVASRTVAHGAAVTRGRWDDLDVLVFAATALWTWVALPLVLDDDAVDVRELAPERDREWRRLEVTVPEGWPSTSARHMLHVDGHGLIRRHDERMEVAGRSVGVSHELARHCEFEGVTVATHRRTRGPRKAPVLWTDVVAAHLIPRRPGP